MEARPNEEVEKKKYLFSVSGFGGKVDDALMISSSLSQSHVTDSYKSLLKSGCIK